MAIPTSEWARHFWDLLVDEVQLERFTGQDQYGNYTYGAATTYRCRVQQGSTLVSRGSEGEEIVSQVQVILPEPVNVQERDRVTLPTDFTHRQPPIVRVIRRRDELGHVHTVIWT